MKSILSVLASLAILGSLGAPALAQSFEAFGLTNAPIGGAIITFQGDSMLVEDGGGGGANVISPILPGNYGVSVQLGEADAGIWVYPYYNGYFSDSEFLVGHVY